MATSSTQAQVLPDAPASNIEDSKNYLKNKRGLASWLLTLDHKRIGIMYLVFITIAFALGGLFAVLVRLELLNPGKDIMSADQYNQAYPLATSFCRSCSAPKTSRSPGSIF